MIQLRIGLKLEKKDYVLDEPILKELPANAPKASKYAREKHVNDSTEVACIMLATMTPEIQKTFDFHEAFEMIEQLRQERFETLRAFIGCKMDEGSSMSAHVLKMKTYVEQLARLRFPFGDELATDVILASFPKSFNQFVMNFTMNDQERSIKGSKWREAWRGGKANPQA
uniref:Zinc finger, CCHC-type n=1 Tax=Lactuca sativa TaxID=4236 RepID=A0A9R1XM55_LACSA|nr:hypothetical protein LSAT_V11C400220920 [Lactuca sativa]